MIKVNCEACGAPYDVDPRRIPASGLKMRCPSCGASFHVQAPKADAGAFDLDLPAAKGPARTPGRPAAQAAAAKPAMDLTDLPAAKGARLPESLPENLADDLVDPSGPGAILRPEFDIDLPAAKHNVDLPARKGAPKPARFAPDFGANIVDAPKAAALPKPSADMELDLPAPKAAFVPKKPASSAKLAPAPTQLPAPSLPMPTPAANKPSFGSLDLDLPAPKQPAAAQAKAAQKPFTSAAARPSLSADLELDLPAPKPAAAAVTPAVVKSRETQAGGFDLDLPTPKAASPGGSKSFSRPSLEANLPAVKTRTENLNAGMAKDSLAVDPSPMFAGQRAGGALGELDEVQINFGSLNQVEVRTASRDAARDQGHVDLPAPSNLPAVKQKPAGTMLGLGQGAGKFAKDSLDIPRGFEPADDPSNFELGDLLPAPADLPQAKQAKPKQERPAEDPFADLDLPAPADLPVTKKAPAAGTMLGLGQAGAAKPAEKPASKAFGIGQMLDESLGQPGAAAAGNFDFELDLPPPTRSNPDASGPINLERLSLPSAEAAGRGQAPFGATMALGADDLEMGGMSLHGMGDDDPFKNLGRSPSNNQTIELDSMLEFGRPAGNAFDARRGGGGGDAFGELDFGLDNGPKTGGLPLVAPRPVPVSQHPPGFDARAVEAELLGDEAAVGTEARPRKKRKAKKEGKSLPGYVWPILLVVVIGGVGAGLGMFTHHGYFGVYLLEQLLPAAGDPARVAEAITQAEKIAKTDTFVDVRKSLVVLSDARNEAGLNHELLARSLLNEALYQLRFGDDAQSSQRSVAILARVMERGPDAKGLGLARAADSARRGQLPQASELLAQVPAGRDALRGLVAGEIALLKKQPETATKGFRESLAAGGGARAHWGLARALLMQEKLGDAEESAKATLAESPLHPSALTFLAKRAFARGETQTALELTRKATGELKVGDARARPSRSARADAFALAGQIEQALEHPREAQLAYEASLAADPVRTETLIGSGSMLMRLGRARDALSRFETALSAKPASAPDASGKVPLVEATVGAVQALLILERPSDAMTRIGALATQFPKEPQVSVWQGHTLEALEKWDEAEAAFRKTIELSPKSFSGYVALSQLLFKRSRPEEGARVLADATGNVKDSAEVRRLLGYSELTRNHLPEAIHHFEAALRFDANDAGALLGMTTAQRKSGNLSVAEKTLAKLEKLEPTFAGLTLERGQLLESRGDYTGAAAAYKLALETRPHDTDLKLRLGAALVTAGRLDEAEAILPEVLKERPTSAEAEHFIGRVLLAKKETAQAVQHFERSIAFDALRGEYHLYLAWAYLDQANLGGALSTINKALERDPNLADARWILGRIQLRTGAVKDAVLNFQQALKLKPGRVEALANMGDAYDQLRDLPAAIRSYQEAVRHAPENADWWYRLGTLQLDRGSRDEARVALAEAVLRGDRLIEKPSWLADAHRLYAEVLRDSGRVGEAIEHYRVFLETAPNGHPDRPEVERIVTSGQR